MVFSKEKLIAKKTNAILNYGDQSWLSFNSSSLKTQTSYKYSKKTDITVEAATEYSKNDSKEEQKPLKHWLMSGTNWLNKKLLNFSDLSKHIISLATTVTNNGGSFIIKFTYNKRKKRWCYKFLLKLIEKILVY